MIVYKRESWASMAGKNDATIALVNPPIMKGSFRHLPYLPIGLAYLAAVLEEDGYNVTVLDCSALDMNHDELQAKLTSIEPMVAGITAMATTIQSALLSAQVAKKACSNATVVLGGPHATFMDEQILNEEKAVDIIVRGEGEQTILDVAQTLANSKSLSMVDGITFRSNGQIIRTPDRQFIQHLDDLPKPSYEHFSLEKYRVFGKRIMPVISSRGCPLQCSFCVSSRMFGRAFRARSPEKVVDEIEWLINKHDADALTFYDDTLTFDKKRIYSICDEIANRKIHRPWDCQTRVDQVSRELLAKMHKAGCQQVFFGVESGCQQILDAVNKKTSIIQNEKAIKMAKNEGLFVTISVIIGYPGETRDTLIQTLDFVKKVKPDDAYLCVATPYPGTELRKLVEKNGWKMSLDWSLYDTITPVFENPDLSSEEIEKSRTKFYNSFYSPTYVLRRMMENNFYSKIMARTALNHLFWRLKHL